MTFSEAMKRQALDVLRKYKIGANENFNRLDDRLYEEQPFADLDPDEQQALFEAVRYELANAAVAAASVSVARPGTTKVGTSQPSNSGRVDTRAPLADAAIKSPFRFVPLNDQVLEASPELGKSLDRSQPLPGGLSGSIEVEWAVETPLLIGQTIVEQPFDRSWLEQSVRAARRPHPSKLSEVAIPMAFAPGQFVIPGATLKGLVRSNLQIVTFGRLGQINGNHRYGLRDFEHPLFKGDGGDRPKRLEWDALGAGLLRPARADDPAKQEGDSDYVLEPCEKRMVRMEDIIPFARPHVRPARPGEPGFRQWAQEYYNWLNLPLADKYRLLAVFSNDRLDTSPRFQFITGDDEEGRRYAIPSKSKGNRSGFFVFAGRSPLGKDDKVLDQFVAKLTDQLSGKKKQGGYRRQEYVFLPIEGAQPVRVSARAWEQFRRLNSLPGKTRFRATGSWEVLEPTLKAGRPVPIFHTGSAHDPENEDNRFEIGLTRLFKIAHERSVDEVVRRHHPAHIVPTGYDASYQPDMVEALLGYLLVEDEANEDSLDPAEVGRKSRVGFGFARLAEKQAARPGPVREAVMMGPRASFAPFYLSGAGAGSVIDWSEPTSRLAGRKRYFPRYPAGGSGGMRESFSKAIEQSIPERASQDSLSHMVFLEPEAGREMLFRSTIRFHNVQPEEIGAVLWALTFGGECEPTKPFRHMIGRGKPFGAGQCRVRRIDLAGLAAHDAAGAPLLSPAEPWEVAGAAREGWVAAGGRSLGPFLRAFDTLMTKRLSRDWARSPQIEGLLHASAPDIGAEAARQGRAIYPQLTEFAPVRKAVKPGSSRVSPGTLARLLGTGSRRAARPYLTP